MGASELLEWRAHYRRAPWGSMRDNVHAGIVAATVRNVHLRKGAKPLGFSDFILRSADEERGARARSVFGMLKAMAKKRVKHD